MMWMIDVSQGFGFGLGFAPFVAAIWIALRVLDQTVFGTGEEQSVEREKAAFERGFQDGLKSRWIERMNERLDDSLNRKIADIRAAGERISERTESGAGPHA